MGPSLKLVLTIIDAFPNQKISKLVAVWLKGLLNINMMNAENLDYEEGCPRIKV